MTMTDKENASTVYPMAPAIYQTVPAVYQTALETDECKDDYHKKLLDFLVKSGANPEIINDFIENCI